MRRITAITIAALTAALAFTFANDSAEAGGGCHSDTLTDAPGIAVELEKRCFEPMVVRLDAGEQVTWTNNDPDAHAVTGVANSWGNDDELGQGDAVTYQFDNNGVFPYFCYLHPSMVGARRRRRREGGEHRRGERRREGCLSRGVRRTSRRGRAFGSPGRGRWQRREDRADRYRCRPARSDRRLRRGSSSTPKGWRRRIRRRRLRRLLSGTYPA